MDNSLQNITAGHDVPDVLIPHLYATMSLPWNDLPASIVEKLKTIGEVQEGHTDSSNWLFIADRCGSEALEAMLNFSNGNEPISYDAMKALQSYVIDAPKIEFRSASAFTSVRSERYAWFEGIEEMFARKIEKDQSEEIHPLVKAIRTYIDIIFFHPFENGNARSAMLWMSCQLLRNKIAVPDFRRIHNFNFVPGNKLCYLEFCEFITGEVSNG